MARLKSHGEELARYVKHHPDSEFWTRNRTDVSVRSDGHIMKSEVGYQRGSQMLVHRYHTWGWKLWLKVKPGRDDILTVADAYLTKRGFVRI